jgi:integrase
MAKRKDRDGVFQRKDRQGWWVSYINRDGMRQRQKVEAHTRAQAVAVLGLIKARAEKERELNIRPDDGISTAELMAKYKRYQRTHTKPTTFSRLEGMLDAIVMRLPAKAKDIRRSTVSEYIAQRAEEVGPATIRKEVAVIQHALNLAVTEWELFAENRAAGVKLPAIPDGRRNYLTPPELKAALEAAPEWMKAPIALAAFTGMRRGEILALRWLDVDLANRRMFLRETKNGSMRIPPLNGLAVQVLLSLPMGAPADLVFPGLDGQKLSVYTKRLFESVGIQGASYHTTRHTYASWLAMEGESLHSIGQLLGHKTPRMTTRYAHLSPEYLATSTGKLDRVFGDVLPINRAQNDEKGRTLVPTASPL